MGSIELRTLSGPDALVAVAHGTDEPVVVYDGEDECLVAGESDGASWRQVTLCV